MRYLILMVFLMSCASSDLIVESDYSYKAKFHRYKTFDFAVINGFNGSQYESQLLEKYVENILTSWGYKRTTKKPDVYIYYSVYFDDVELIGYNQKKLRDWSGLNDWYRQEIEQKDSLFMLTDSSKETEIETVSSEERYHSHTLKLTEGTLLISFYDRKKKITAWQGYASGFFGKEGIKNERVLRAAVIKILDEFRLPIASI